MDTIIEISLKLQKQIGQEGLLSITEIAVNTNHRVSVTLKPGMPSYEQDKRHLTDRYGSSIDLVDKPVQFKKMNRFAPGRLRAGYRGFAESECGEICWYIGFFSIVGGMAYALNLLNPYSAQEMLEMFVTLLGALIYIMFAVTIAFLILLFVITPALVCLGAICILIQEVAQFVWKILQNCHISVKTALAAYDKGQTIM